MKKIISLFVAVICFFTVFSYGCGKSENRCLYEIECELEGNTLSGKETVTFFNGGENTVKELKFNLFGNAFRKGAKYKPISAQNSTLSYPNGMSYGEMTVLSVKENGKDATFKVGGVDENILYVPLSEELFPNESVKVYLEFNLKLADVVARTGINDKTVNLGNFYPILCGIDENGFYECTYYPLGDPFFSDCADYDVKITCDSEYVVASSGNLVGFSSNGEKSTSRYKINSARSFCMILSKNFEFVSGEVDGIKINYYFYDDPDFNGSFQYAEKSIKTFNEKFGAYPYETFSVVQTGFIEGGMEYPSIVMISDRLDEKEIGEVIVHETAHQWWQTAVGNNEIEYGFLDEGLAEYSTIIFYEFNKEYNLTRKSLSETAVKTYKTFCTVYDKLFGGADTSMIKNLKDFKSDYEYVNISYIKGCIMYDLLRESIGDNKFFAGLKNYYDKYCFRNATPYDLIGAFEDVGADVDGFFTSFFDGKVII